MAVALIPVKELSQAKERLSPVLDAAGRRALALAMFRDVLAAALACDALEGVTVVSRDPDVLDEARAAGAEGMAGPGGLNEALESAAKKLAKRGVGRILVLAADVPTARPDAIAAVLSADAKVAIVPSQDGGTNALAMTPDAIPFLFGKDSARRHVDAAENAGLSALILDVLGLTLDIDTPDDLQRLVGASVGKHTRAALTGLDLPPVRPSRVTLTLETFKLREGSPEDFPLLALIDGAIANESVLFIERKGQPIEQDIAFHWGQTKQEGSERESNIEESELAEQWKRCEKVIIAEDFSGLVTGYVMLGANWNRTAEIAMIIVHRAYQGMGIGGRFIEEAEAFARERGLRAVQWEVQNDNRNAIEFALAHGFRIAGFNDALYRNDDLERQREAGFRGIALYLTKALA